MSELLKKLKTTMQLYFAAFPAETEALAQIRDQVEGDAHTVFLRSNMNGHVTASALVLNQARSHVLMIFHPTHNRWLQPGGHIEARCISLWQAAMEEVEQETGLATACPIKGFGDSVPLDIDTHAIAENKRKGEGSHFHHDFMFLAEAPNDFVPNPHGDDAVKIAKWLPIGDFFAMQDARMQRMAAKLSAAGIATSKG